MIQVGLSGWGDHFDLYRRSIRPQEKLRKYSSYFNTVELDSSFYAIQSPDLMKRWCEETPSEFAFLVKAYQGMTGHLRGGKTNFSDTDSTYAAFKASIAPMREAGKLKAVLFQFPPWFTCERSNVDLLREVKRRMEDIPVALEFRHQSWFNSDMLPRTIAFMRNQGWIHSICDEPQVGMGSIPTVLETTNDQLTIVRMHGRNVDNWNTGGAPNWREVRYLYRYNSEELLDWKRKLDQLQEHTKEVCVIFNNNSGGDAAANALELLTYYGIQHKLPDPEPEQLALFDE